MDQNQEQNSLATETAADDVSAIMQLAEKADTGVTAETVDQPQPEATQPKEEAAKTPAPAAAVSPKADEPKQDEEAPPERTPYQQAVDRKQKDEARLDRSWKKLHEEKEEIRRQREQLARRPESPGSAKDPGKTYEDLARDYRNKGDHKMAELALEKAEEARDKVRQADDVPDPDAHWDTPAFQRGWSDVRDTLIRQDPTLADPANPVVKIANDLVNDKEMGPIARSHPNGLKAAVGIARLMIEANSHRLQVQKLREEVKRLSSLTSVEGGNGWNASSRRSPDDMSDVEREAHLRRAMLNADGA
jgi:hypothetical protein